LHDDCKDYNIVIDPELKLLRTYLWKIFQQWKKDVGRDKSKITRNKFYSSLSMMKIETRILSGYSYFVGFGIEDGLAPTGQGAAY